MVFARSKILIHDYCLEEKPVALTLSYNGPNPQVVIKKYVELLKLVFKVSDSEIQEKTFNKRFLTSAKIARQYRDILRVLENARTFLSIQTTYLILQKKAQPPSTHQKKSGALLLILLQECQGKNKTS